MKYNNLEKFEKWLDEVMPGPYDFDAVLNDIETQYGNTAAEHYELSRFETKSGKPECYYYDVSITFDDDGNADITFIF